MISSFGIAVWYAPPVFLAREIRGPAAVPPSHIEASWKFVPAFISSTIENFNLEEKLVADSNLEQSPIWVEAKFALNEKRRHLQIPPSAIILQQSFEEQMAVTGFPTSGNRTQIKNQLDNQMREHLREFCRQGRAPACDAVVGFLTEQIHELRGLEATRLPPEAAGLSGDLAVLEMEAGAMAVLSCVGGGASCGAAFAALEEDPRARRQLSQLLLDYCHADRRESCLSVEVPLFEDFEEAAAENHAQEELVERRIALVSLSTLNCANGELLSCRRLLESGFISEDDPRTEAALSTLRTNCEDANAGGSPLPACEILASFLQQKGDTPFAMVFADRACERGSAGGCLQVAKLERDRTKDLTAVAVRLKRYCANLAPGLRVQSSQMCAALESGELGSFAFWSRFGSTPVVASTGEVMNLDQYMLSRFLY